MILSHTIWNNKRNFKFEIAFDNGETAYLEYRWLKGAMVLMRTVVPSAYRNQGAGSQLVKHAMELAYSGNYQVILYCPFAQHYINKHPQYQSIVLVNTPAPNP